MAESTLSLKYADLIGQVGLNLGYGQGAANGDPAWPTQTAKVIDSITASGIRQFYFPPPVEGSDSSYDWSFLKPIAQINTTTNSVIVPLPDDFGSFEGRITLVSLQSQVWWPIELVGIGRILSSQSNLPNATGRPLMACLEPVKGTSQIRGQRFQLQVYPIPDMQYTLQFQYYILPDYLTGTAPYCYGGAAHVETILESCLSIAEQRLDDVTNGPHTAKFMERLMASISIDRRSKPQTLGYNGDRSDLRGRLFLRNHFNDRITVYGEQL